MDVHFESSRSLQEICDVGVRRGYLDPDNPLRPSIVADALFDRRNTGDNTPCVLHVELVPGKTVEVDRSEEHTSELQSLMRISYAVFCLKKKHTMPNA